MTDLNDMFTGAMTLAPSEKESLAGLVRMLLHADTRAPDETTVIAVSPDFRVILATVLAAGTAAIEKNGVRYRFTADGETR